MTEVLERANGTPVRAFTEPTTNGDARAEALSRLKKKREFKTHLLAYVLVNASLWAIWAIIAVWQGMLLPWPIFPMLGWGIGLTFHAWETYGRKPFSEAQIEGEMRHLRP